MREKVAERSRAKEMEKTRHGRAGKRDMSWLRPGDFGLATENESWSSTPVSIHKKL